MSIYPPLISVIIPSLNDGNLIEKNLLPQIQNQNHSEIEFIVVEAGETKIHSEKIKFIPSPQANRAYQMNLGASQAQGNLLVFLHADTYIDIHTLTPLYEYLQFAHRYVGGTYRFALNQNNLKAKIVEFGVRLREWIFDMPFGDQALFVRKKIFQDCGGFSEVPILEDVIFIRELQKRGQLYDYPEKAITDARKWEEYGYSDITWINWATMFLWSRGMDLERIINLRKKWMIQKN